MIQTDESTIRHEGGAQEHGPGGPARIVVTGDQTGGRFALIEAVVGREHEPPLHIHTREDEIIYVVDGALDISIAGERTPVEQGESVFLPRGREHAYRLRSEGATLLHMTLPAGIEGFYRELDETVTDSCYIERLIALAARYGIEITGPGLRETADTEGGPSAD